jgi:hypothetical protein
LKKTLKELVEAMLRAGIQKQKILDALVGLGVDGEKAKDLIGFEEGDQDDERVNRLSSVERGEGDKFAALERRIAIIEARIDGLMEALREYMPSLGRNVK